MSHRRPEPVIPRLRFMRMHFRGGPWDGKRSRVQYPLPAVLRVPIVEGHRRVFGRDETHLAGIARYALRTGRGHLYYVIVNEERFTRAA